MPDDWRVPMVPCEVVRRAVHATGHCMSCHDDEDEGYRMCEIETRKGVVAVCCEVYAACGATEGGSDG